jgi:CRP-like cAMP-binding protein
MAQRTRLAAQCRQRVYASHTNIVSAHETGSELYIVQTGTVEVWNDPDSYGQAPRNPRRAATLRPGQMVGEFAMLDQGLRSADLITGPEGATVLALDRTAMSQRARFILWQLQRALQRQGAQAVRGQSTSKSASVPNLGTH